MYAREDEDQARRLWKKRLGLALVPMIVGLAAGIALFVEAAGMHKISL